MKYSRRLEIFGEVRTRYIGFLESVLWKLTGDQELFAEAMQYALLAIWRNIEKLDSKKARRYIYKIALSANSKAWRNRIGKDGQLTGCGLPNQTTENDVDDAEQIALLLTFA